MVKVDDFLEEYGDKKSRVPLCKRALAVVKPGDEEDKPDSKIQRDYRGKKVGIIFYDDQTDVSMKGYIPRESPADIKVAQTLVLANVAPDHGLNTVSSGTNIVTGVKIGLKNEDLASFEVSSTIYDF